MVNPSKDDEILVNNPATIKSEKTDSDKDAMRPKKVRRKSRPIILVKAPPRPYQRSAPPNSLLCPWLRYMSPPNVILMIKRPTSILFKFLKRNLG
tara:strand:+ start:341 stop:625 length:285 start_codon:yes stop_codon:yes gene_type:complete